MELGISCEVPTTDFQLFNSAFLRIYLFRQITTATVNQTSQFSETTLGICSKRQQDFAPSVGDFRWTRRLSEITTAMRERMSRYFARPTAFGICSKAHAAFAPRNGDKTAMFPRRPAIYLELLNAKNSCSFGVSENASLV